jgi:hypothetical protein
MGVYQHPTENRTYFAPDREPMVDLPFQLWHISGLDNFSIPHPMFVKKSDFASAHGINANAVVSHATTGSGPSASFLGSDERRERSSQPIERMEVRSGLDSAPNLHPGVRSVPGEIEGPVGRPDRRINGPSEGMLENRVCSERHIVAVT